MASDTNQVTMHTVQTTNTKETIKEAAPDWLHVTVTLWPVVVIIAMICFYRQVAQLLQDLAGLTFGSFSLKLRKRVSKFTDSEQYSKVQQLSAYDLKCFFIVASQSWRVKKVEWNMPVQDMFAVQQRLQGAGLVRINNMESAIKEGNVDSIVTPFGDDFYQELTSVIAESIR
jgi:hypothetical protein